jgi:tRNA pseudouridine38-40 synthase
MSAGQRYKIACAYVGTAYRGWQWQPDGVRTVQGALEGAIEAFVGPGNASRVVTSSRTDAGVHALRNVFHVDMVRRRRQSGDVLPPHEPATVAKALNAQLRLRGEHASIVEVALVDGRDTGWHAAGGQFHARHSASHREYAYRIAVAPGEGAAPSVFERERMWWARAELDADAMAEAARHLVGRHDFSSFRGSGCQATTPWRTLADIRVRRVREPLFTVSEPACFSPPVQLLEVRVTARSFLYHNPY